ncbi:branched-subunit amino acid transport protein [Thermosediminibacter litoriperuensis]|uniref:Branched-chain amino acid transport system carrier protein n=1 Tax=Thermosediminibacter litoriperuensis TaxID=291989 RepID=A0A5S5AC44_9FIRM|nr:branched-subunit amino acid transport protein [Thermosediminibacter litoriperuensis]
MNKKLNDVVVIGFALFAMFFGAGNLIFPPYIGYQLSSKWFLGILGFILTGIGLPLLGIIAMAQNEGNFENFAGKVGKPFAKGLYFFIVLCIGPLLAIPRTGATTYEMGIAPIMPDFNILLASLIFFAINIYFLNCNIKCDTFFGNPNELGFSIMKAEVRKLVALFPGKRVLLVAGSPGFFWAEYYTNSAPVRFVKKIIP